jgi:phosphoglucosamine mutase
VFSKYETTGDGLVTAIMVMESVVERKTTLSKLLRGYKALPQVACDVPVTDKRAAMVGVNELAVKLEGKLKLRIIARASGTESLIRLMAEGESEENCALACKILAGKIIENCD